MLHRYNLVNIYKRLFSKSIIFLSSMHIHNLGLYLCKVDSMQTPLGGLLSQLVRCSACMSSLILVKNIFTMKITSLGRRLGPLELV